MPEKKNNIIIYISLLDNLKLPVLLKIIKRPKDIPAIVPDCGWNHGEDTDNANHFDKTDKKRPPNIERSR